MIYNSSLFLANTTPEFQRCICPPLNPATLHYFAEKTKLSKNTNRISDATVFVLDMVSVTHLALHIEGNVNLFLTPEIKNRINSGNARLVLNFWSEAVHHYTNPWFDPYYKTIYDILKTAGIDVNQITLISGDIKAKETYAKNKSTLDVIGINSFEFIYNYWMFREQTLNNITVNNFIKSKKEFFNKFSINKPRRVLFLNGRPRMHRCLLKYFLEKTHVLKNSTHSWAIGNEKVTVNEIATYIKTHTDLELPINDVTNVCNVLKELDHPSNKLVSFGHQCIIKKKWLTDTVFSIVGETDVTEHMLFLTEKTYKTILYMHPFQIYGNPLTLKFLRDNGYETFPEMFDETYDTLIGKSAVRKKLNLICKNTFNFQDRISGKEPIIQEKLEHNQQRFLSQLGVQESINRLRYLFER